MTQHGSRGAGPADAREHPVIGGDKLDRTNSADAPEHAWPRAPLDAYE